MEPKNYIVVRLDGDYACLKDLVSGEDLFIARALIPEESDEGTFLHYENLCYTVVGQN
ncbi:MAG: hypothetical protein IKN17_11205 [Ruminococcus sp.]|nr:hypothetical protein [Ruminococcus sp.]